MRGSHIRRTSPTAEASRSEREQSRCKSGVRHQRAGRSIVDHLTDTEEAGGAEPSRRTIFHAPVAQCIERRASNAEVAGEIPAGSTTFPHVAQLTRRCLRPGEMYERVGRWDCMDGVRHRLVRVKCAAAPVVNSKWETGKGGAGWAGTASQGRRNLASGEAVFSV